MYDSFFNRFTFEFFMKTAQIREHVIVNYTFHIILPFSPGEFFFERLSMNSVFFLVEVHIGGTSLLVSL